MASGDTKTQEYLNLAATGTRADLPAARGCCNTRTQNLIVDVADRIITEEETRAAADRVLQGEIDEIRNNPDVADIVPTYAALQDYDTSTLTDKDIIRVLVDSTHGGASTYYRWSTSTETFTYIGEVGDYYTKSQTDALLSEKQDELTAGDNITIEDESGALVISATDTTYTAGSNISISSSNVISAAGLVTLSYGSSTWNDFITAYNAGKIVYCRASSSANPATGSQTRMAFMAYVSNPTNPTNVEFQYVRSVSSKTSSAQCDQVFVYKLTNANGGTWTVETRDMASTIAAGANAELTYSGTTATINPRLYTTTGQNTNGGITQKLFSDTVGDIESALNAINNGTGA